MTQSRTPRRTREQWMALVEQFRTSGLRAEEFCQRHRLVLGTFRKYLYGKAAVPQRHAIEKPSGFSPINVSSQLFEPTQHPIQIDIGRGVQLNCSDSIGIDTIAQLALALRHGN